MHAGVGIVSQESQLFNTTLVDNIRYGAFDASIEEVQRACEAGPSREHFEGIGLLLRHGGLETRQCDNCQCQQNPPQ